MDDIIDRIPNKTWVKERTLDTRGKFHHNTWNYKDERPDGGWAFITVQNNTKENKHYGMTGFCPSVTTFKNGKERMEHYNYVPTLAMAREICLQWLETGTCTVGDEYNFRNDSCYSEFKRRQEKGLGMWRASEEKQEQEQAVCDYLQDK